MQGKTRADAPTYETYCRSCGRSFDQDAHPIRCSCGGKLHFRYTQPADPVGNPAEPGIWRYAANLPVDRRYAVSLEEGNTPLLRARLFPSIELFLKDETRNPTGSMKDRALAVGVSKIREWGAPQAVLFSMGSTGLAAAAYTARAGVDLAVLVLAGAPEEAVFPLRQMGAKVVAIRGDADTAMTVLQNACEQYGFIELTTCRASNPYQSEAPKTIAYEIVRQAGEAPDWVVAPVGGGGTIAGLWHGFRELQAAGAISKVPRMLAVQVRGYHALRVALDRGLFQEEKIVGLLDDAPAVETIATKLAHRFPFDAEEVLEAVRGSDGDVVVVDDDACMAWAARLASTEGIFAEPSSATVLAGLDQMIAIGRIGSESRVVALATGSGFREIPLWSKRAPRGETPAIDPEPEMLARAIARRRE